MKYEVKFTSKFKKDFKLIKKRDLDLQLFSEVVEILADGSSLPAKYHDHPLIGDYKGNRECHISPDWLLIYKIHDNCLVLTLIRTGSHSDLF